MGAKLTVKGVLEDKALREREFPVSRERAFMAHAAVAPFPARVARAVSDYAARVSEAGQFEFLHEELRADARRLAAGLMGCSPAEIAFAPSTSAGLSMVAAGLDWSEGESVVAAEGDFPANIHPWLGLEGRGVEVRLIPRRHDGLVKAEDVIGMLDDTVRLVSLSTVNYLTGAPIDVGHIGAALAERGILFCLDAIQSLGAFPVPLEHVDFLVADAHKWLLGPEGIALMYVSEDRFEELTPVIRGWRSVRRPGDVLDVRQGFADSARRYEPGSLNVLGISGLHAALSLLREAGPAQVSARLTELRSRMAEGLKRKGCRLLGPISAGAGSPITTFVRGHADMKALHAALEGKGVITSFRRHPDHGGCIRLSPHFYNTDEDVERLLSAL